MKKTYRLAHPETSWGDLEYRSVCYDDGYDLVAIKPNGVLVFRRRNILVRFLRRFTR